MTRGVAAVVVSTCTLLAPLAWGQTPIDAGALSEAELVDVLIEHNDRAAERYASIEYHLSQTISEPGMADHLAVTAHVILDSGRRRYELVRHSSPLMKAPPMTEPCIYLDSGAYVVYWPVSYAAAYQHLRDDDGRIVNNPLEDNGRNAAPPIVERLCGNSSESLGTYHRGEAAKLQWKARPGGDPGTYWLSVDNGGAEASYLLDSDKGFIITHVVTRVRGNVLVEEDYDLSEVAPGLWFPRQLTVIRYDPSATGAVKSRRLVQVWGVVVNPKTKDSDFTLEGLPIPEGTYVHVVAADGKGQLMAMTERGLAPADGMSVSANAVPATPAIAGEPTQRSRAITAGAVLILVAAASALGAAILWLRARRPA
jgi:hypothetical protein